MNLLLQVAVIFTICLAGEWLSAVIPFPLPASVISMILLFLLLVTRLVKLDRISDITEFLLKYMALFFVPAGVGLMEHFGVISENLIPFLTICTVSTILTFAVTGYTVKLVIAIQNKLQGGGKVE